MMGPLETWGEEPAVETEVADESDVGLVKSCASLVSGLTGPWAPLRIQHVGWRITGTGIIRAARSTCSHPPSPFLPSPSGAQDSDGFRLEGAKGDTSKQGLALQVRP